MGGDTDGSEDGRGNFEDGQDGMGKHKLQGDLTTENAKNAKITERK